MESDVFGDREGDAHRFRRLELEAHNIAMHDTLAELEASLVLHRDLFESAPIGYCLIDVLGRVLRVNSQAEAIIGRGRHALLGTTLSNYLPLSQRAAFVQSLRESDRQGCNRSIEIDSFVLPQNHVRTHVVVQPEHDDSGYLLGHRVALVQVSDRKAIEDKLRLLSDVAEVLASSLEYADNLAQALDVVPHTFAELTFIDLRHDDQRHQRIYPKAADAACQSTRLWCDNAFVLEHPGAAQAQVLHNQSPLCSANVSPAADDPALRQTRAVMIVPLVAHGRALGTATFVRGQRCPAYGNDDLRTALELAGRFSMAVFSGQLHAQAQNSMRARQKILGTVSHDMKNIITCLKMRTEGLSGFTDAKVARNYSHLHRLVGRIESMVDDLLDVASIENGFLSLRPVAQSAQTLIEEAIDNCGHTAALAQVTLCAEGPSVDVYCDPERCLQVLTNLLSNAIKYSPAGGRVVVAVQRLNDCRAVISVADEGPGVAAENAERIFESFWQVPGSAAPGHGLGLAISRGIVEASGGRIWVEPREGGGSIFLFSMPLDQR